MDPNLPSQQPPAPAPAQPVAPTPPPVSQPVLTQPMQSDDDMAAKRKMKMKISAGVLLAFVVGIAASAIYFTKIQPTRSVQNTGSKGQTSIPASDLVRKAPPKTDNKFQPIPALTALLNCGLTPDAQKVLDQDFIINAGTTMAIIGKIKDLQYPSNTQASLTLQKYNNNDTITLPIKVENDGIIKNAKLVTNGENKPNTQTIDTLKKKAISLQ